MLIVGLDFEATGLDPKVDRIIEVGAALWDTEQAIPLKMVSELVNPRIEIPLEIEEITGISNEDVQTYGVSEDAALYAIRGLLNYTPYVMAHNGTIFDRPLYEEAEVRSGPRRDPIKWLDSITDIVLPPRIKTRNLRHLASEHGFLNPFSHRAIFDVLTMLTIASEYSIEAIIERAAEPTVYLQALVSFDDKDKAKERGYKWCGPQKMWWKAMKQSDAEGEMFACGFRTFLLGKSPE